jgi:L-amino acid N-acyltransferase YncA
MWTIRDARVEDLPAIDRIYDHYVRTSTCTYQLEPEGLRARAAWFAEHDADHPVVVVEEAAERAAVVAWGCLSPYRARAGYRFTVEDSVYVDHSRHGRGIGSAILAHLVERAQAAGHHAILAGISDDQLPSIRLHAKLGFVEVARLREVGRKFDQWLDVIFLERLLAVTKVGRSPGRMVPTAT